ncbi:MAG: glutamate formimidoyltransferase [Acidobacteriota bacterium]
MPLLECVPNFSEGHDTGVVVEIVNAIASAPGVAVLGYEMDSDHNRSVVTFAGEHDAVVAGAVRGAARAAELIDIRERTGVHPRVGAADVIPFIPLDGSSMADAVDAAGEAGEKIWARAGVPVYFYGEAARTESRRRLEKTRRTGFDGAPPDIGDIASHPSAGASMVGARDFLVAYNVDLTTSDVNVAHAIAKVIRESSGGFPYVKSIGLYLASRDRAQVSMNLTKFDQIPLDEVYSKIEATARQLGAGVAACELIGFVPERAFNMFPAFFQRAGNFSEARILEFRLRQLLP